MSKTELVTFVAEEAGLTKVDAAKAVEAFIAGVEKGLKLTGGILSATAVSKLGAVVSKSV